MVGASSPIRMSLVYVTDVESRITMDEITARETRASRVELRSWCEARMQELRIPQVRGERRAENSVIEISYSI